MADENAKIDNNKHPVTLGINVDGEIRDLRINDDGSIDVNIQDQTSEIVDYYMCRTLGETTPSVSAAIDAQSITVVSTSGAVSGKCIDIFENGRQFQAIIKSISGSVINFNAPLDQDISVSADVKFGEWNMNFDGSSGMLVYEVAPPSGIAWDITRIIIGMSDDVVMDDGKFGGIPSLSNGVVLRVNNGYKKNIFIASNNGGLRERSFDIAYASKAPAGEYGFGCRRTFAGQDKNGVAIRLHGNTGDSLEMLIQDDLTDLLKLAVVCQGHVVID